MRRVDAWARATEHSWLWLTVLATLLALQVSPWWYPAPDGVVYVSTARGIALEHRLTAFGNPQLGYPPGYPLLISAAFWFTDPPFLAIAVLHWVLAVVLMLGVYRWARQQCPDAALLVTAFVMVNVSLWVIYRRTLSELAFMTLLVWVCQLLNAALDSETFARRFVTCLIGGLLVAALSMIREVGVVVIAGFASCVAIAVWTRRLSVKAGVLQTLLVAVPPIVGVLGFVRYEAAMRAASTAPVGTHSEGLLHVMRGVAPQLVEGVRLRISEVGRLLLPGMFKSYAGAGDWIDINIALYVPFFALVAAGWWVMTKRRTDTLALTLPFYLFVYVVWSFDSATRYLTPFLPVLVGSLWYAFAPLARWRPILFGGLLVAHLGVALGFWIIVEMPRARACTAHWEVLGALVREIPVPARGNGSAMIAPCERLLLGLLLDRHVGASAPANADQSTQWIVSDDTASIPQGYNMAAHSPPYRLWVMDHHAGGATSDAR